MGILGLTGFIDRNPHLLHKHDLKDTSVIIDGNNFFHYLYCAYDIESIFGGDYDIYRQKIVLNLKCMLKCNIKPYIVLDGGYTTDDKKLQNSLKRAIKQIQKAKKASLFGRCRMTTLLAHDTFIQTLDELGIPHATCQFEADNEIAKLANKMKCPVISNDSDFYIFDLMYGFLPLDYIDFNPLYKVNEDGSKSSPFLFCRKYQVEDFVNSFKGLSCSVLPVFATLLGNDYVSPNSVNNVYARVQVPKVCKKINIPNKLSKVVKLIHWLEMNSVDVEDILETILPFVESKKRFLKSVIGYYDIMNFEGCDLMNFFFGEEESFKPIANKEFCGFNGTAFPDWFLLSVCKGEITPATLNAAVLHRIIFQCQLEHLSSQTVYQCCDSVRKVIYGILMQSDPPSRKRHMEKNFFDYSFELSKAKKQREDYEKFVRKRELEENNENDNPSVKCVSPCDGETNIEQQSSNSNANSSEDEDAMKAVSNSDTGILASNLDEEFCKENEEDKMSNNDEVIQKVNTNSEEESNLHKESCKDCDEGDEMDNTDEVIQETQGVQESTPQRIPPSILKQTRIEEYERHRQSLKKRYTEPVMSIENEPLPTLSAIGDLGEQKRLSILLAALGAGDSLVNAFSSDCALYAQCLSLWVKNANPQITENHLDCAILGSILIHMQNAGRQNKSAGKRKLLSKNKEQIDMKLQCRKSRSCEKFRKTLDNLSKYHLTKPNFGLKNPFNIEISHSFVQLQCCMYEVSNLNKILRFPLPNIKPADVFNGTFLYNFFVDLITRSTPQLFIEAMLFTGSDMHNLFLQFKSIILNSLPQNCFGDLGLDVKKRRKKKKGKKKRRKSDTETAVSDNNEKVQSSSDREENEEEIVTVDGFNINNTFALLSTAG